VDSALRGGARPLEPIAKYQRIGVEQRCFLSTIACQRTIGRRNEANVRGGAQQDDDALGSIDVVQRAAGRRRTGVTGKIMIGAFLQNMLSENLIR
jgi:hypothetical protein